MPMKLFHPQLKTSSVDNLPSKHLRFLLFPNPSLLRIPQKASILPSDQEWTKTISQVPDLQERTAIQQQLNSIVVHFFSEPIFPLIRFTDERASYRELCNAQL